MKDLDDIINRDFDSQGQRNRLESTDDILDWEYHPFFPTERGEGWYMVRKPGKKTSFVR